MRPATVLAAVALLVGTAGCAGQATAGRVADEPVTVSSSAPSAPAAVDAGASPLVVDVERSRSAAARGTLEVRLRTSGDEPVEVTSLQLLDDRFDRVPVAPKSTTVRPGSAGVITPIPAGQVRCDVAPDRGPVMAVTFAAGGADVAAELPVSPAGDAVLTRYHAEECRRRELLAAVGVAFGDEWTEVAPATARGTIRLSRLTDEGPVVLEQVQGTVIFSLEVLGTVPPSPVLVLPPGTAAAEVAVEVSAARCDPHALIESKKTYLFPMWMRRGEAPAVFLTVAPRGPAREVFADLLADGCHVPR